MGKALAYVVTDGMGAQYIREGDGLVITVGPEAIITDADEKTMYVEAMVDGKKKMALKYGFEVLEDYVKPATAMDAKLAEASALKKLAAENVALKKKLEEREKGDG
jgi:hypothetical protein